MKDIINSLRTGALAARMEHRSIFPLKAWVSSWLLRVIAQTLLFALLGLLVGGQGDVTRLLAGACTFLAITSALTVIVSTGWDRDRGIHELIAASPGHAFPIIAAKGIQWLIDGVLVGVIAWLVGAALLLDLTPEQLLGVALCISLSCISGYTLGLFLAIIVTEAPAWRNVIANLAGLLLLLITGAQTPLGFWGPIVETMALSAPSTNALIASTSITSGTGEPFMFLVRELIVATLWLLLATLAGGYKYRGDREPRKIRHH